MGEKEVAGALVGKFVGDCVIGASEGAEDAVGGAVGDWVTLAQAQNRKRGAVEVAIQEGVDGDTGK